MRQRAMLATVLAALAGCEPEKQAVPDPAQPPKPRVFEAWPLLANGTAVADRKYRFDRVVPAAYHRRVQPRELFVEPGLLT